MRTLVAVVALICLGALPGCTKESENLRRTGEALKEAAAKLALIDPLGLKMLLEQKAGLEQTVALLEERLKSANSIGGPFPLDDIKDMAVRLQLREGPEIRADVRVNGYLIGQPTYRPREPATAPSDWLLPIVGVPVPNVKGEGVITITAEFVAETAWVAQMSLVTTLKSTGQATESHYIRQIEPGRHVTAKTDKDGKQVRSSEGWPVWILTDPIVLYGKYPKAE